MKTPRLPPVGCFVDPVPRFFPTLPDLFFSCIVTPPCRRLVVDSSVQSVRAALPEELSPFTVSFLCWCILVRGGPGPSLVFSCPLALRECLIPSLLASLIPLLPSFPVTGREQPVEYSVSFYVPLSFPGPLLQHPLAFRPPSRL